MRKSMCAVDPPGSDAEEGLMLGGSLLSYDVDGTGEPEEAFDFFVRGKAEVDEIPESVDGVGDLALDT